MTRGQLMPREAVVIHCFLFMEVKLIISDSAVIDYNFKLLKIKAYYTVRTALLRITAGYQLSPDRIQVDIT